MDLYVVRIFRRLGCALAVPLLFAVVSVAQTDTTKAEVLGLVISTRIDTAASDAQSLRILLQGGQGDSIANLVSLKCRSGVVTLLADQDISIPVVLQGEDLMTYGKIPRWIYLLNCISIDEWGEYSSRSELIFTDSAQPLLAWKQNLGVVSARGADAVKDSVAARVPREVSRTVANWLVESLYKVRVVVGDFEGSDSDSVYAFLRTGLRNMVESEMARNEAFLVYVAGDSLAQNPINRAYANYEIKGSYFCYEKSIRVDIHCLKRRSGRILLSRSITLDTLSLARLSGQVSLSVNRMKKAMLADDRQGCLTMAVVAEPPLQYFRSQRVVDDAINVARLFRRNVANRLRRMVHLQKDSTHSCLEIHDDTDALDRYLEAYHDPGEIISDLATDYLVLLKLEDFGQRLQVTATLHSYNTDSLIFGAPIFTGDENKAKFRNLIDQTLLRTAWTVCQLGFLPINDTSICRTDLAALEENSQDKTAQKVKDSLISVINQRTSDIRVLDIRPNKGFGLRMGGVQHRYDKLYLGQSASEYLEIFYSYLMPQRRWMRSWMALDMETAVGIDYGGGTLFRHGLTGVQLLVELRLVFTSLQYTDWPITLSLGGGAGIGGIGMKYHPHEAPYAGDNDLEDAVSRFLTTASFRLELPIVTWLRLHLMTRWQFQLGPPVSRFEDKFRDSTVEGPVRGKLDSRHILVGLKVVFR